MFRKLEIIKKTIKEKFDIKEEFWIYNLRFWKDYLRLELTTNTTLIKKSLKPSEIPLSIEELNETIKFFHKINLFSFNFMCRLRISKAYTHYINFKEETFEVCVRSGEFKDFWLVFRYEDIEKSPDDNIWVEVLKR